MDALVILIPLMPLVAASLIGIGHLFVQSTVKPAKTLTADMQLDDHHVCAGFALVGADLLAKIRAPIAQDSG